MQNGLTGLKKAAIPVSKDVQKGLTDLKMQVSPDMETPLDKEIMRQFEDFSKKIIESTNARKDSEELLRKYRNLKLEKVSNNIYRISSF
jgi:Lon protease-like protein